jgi:hypothetical protein
MIPRDNEREFGAMVRRGLASGPAAPESECLDAQLLAAYYERTLSAGEIRACELHVSNCAHCRSQLAALARAEPERAAARPPSFAWLWDWRLLVPITAALTVFVAWISVRQPFIGHKTSGVAPIVAQNQAPKAAPPPPPPASQAVEVTPPSAATKKEQAASPHDTKRLDSLGAADERGEASAANRLGKTQSQAKPRRESNQEAKEKDKSARETAVGGAAGFGRARGAPAQEPSAAPAPATTATGNAAEVQSADQTAELQEPPASTASNKPAATQTAPLSRSAGNLGGKVSGSGGGVAPQKSAAPQTETSTVTSRYKQDESKPILIPTPDANTFWRVAGFDQIQLSRDVGATWQSQLTEPELRLTAGAAPTPKICWVVGSGGAILRTVDGENWQRVKSPTSKDLVSVVAQDADVATIAASDGVTFVTKNGGRSWKKGKKSR